MAKSSLTVQRARIVKPAGACLAVLLGVAVAVAQAGERPNILFIMSDDHAVRAVSVYGDSLVQTPNIDRIAKNGIRFDRAYVGNAICGPSRATMLTGLHSHGNGFYSNEWSGPFDGQQQTVSRLLQDAGYRTAVIGKWHLYSDPVGFDHWDVIDNAMEQGTYYNPSFRSPAGEQAATGYVAELITDKAIAWLSSVSGDDEPFFLMYNHKTPHRDWLPGPRELADWDEGARLPEPDSLFRDLEQANSARRDARMSIAQHMTDHDVKLSMRGNLNEEQQALWEGAFAAGNTAYEAADLSGADEIRWKYQRYVKSYAAAVASMDREIGRLLDYLESNGLADDTLVIYTSDQGFFLGENGWFDKRWMDEVSARIPLVAQWPGTIPPGATTEALVQNIDFAPTLLDVADVSAPQPMHGVSLVELLSGKSPDWQRDLYYHFYENPGFHGVARHYGIRDQRYKLVHYYETGDWELFDLQTDPGDQENLYGTHGYAELTADLKSRLGALRARYGVPAEDPEVPWYHDFVIRMIEQLMRLM